MEKKTAFYAAVVVVVLLVVCVSFTFFRQKQGKAQTDQDLTTCVYENEERKLTVQIPQAWTSETVDEFSGDDEQEASADYGILVYVDGNKEESIYIYYQQGTIKIQEPNAEQSTFETKAGLTGTLYTLSEDGKINLWGVLKEEHYGVHAALGEDLYLANQEKIQTVLESISIEEK